MPFRWPERECYHQAMGDYVMCPDCGYRRDDETEDDDE